MQVLGQASELLASCLQILITTSRDPSTRLVQFAKELKLIFPNSRRMNRGGQVRADLLRQA